MKVVKEFARIPIEKENFENAVEVAGLWGIKNFVINSTNLKDIDTGNFFKFVKDWNFNFKKAGDKIRKKYDIKNPIFMDMDTMEFVLFDIDIDEINRGNRVVQLKQTDEYILLVSENEYDDNKFRD